MAAAGTTAYVIQQDRVDDRILGSLAQEVEEFRAFAEQGVDPSSGQPLTSVEDLLIANIRYSVPDSAEGTLGVLDGTRPVVGAVSGIPLLEYPELVQHAVSRADATQPQFSDMRTRGRHFVYVSLPVEVVGDQTQGLYIIAYDRGLEASDILDTYRIYGVMALGALVLIGMVGWLVAGRLLRPLRMLRSTAQRISETDLSERIPADGKDDISALARTVNAMLDRLELAFRTQRDVLDDAGHELRTPITIIRGHLEVMNEADAVEVAETRTLALDELDRMHTMVDELVLLAKTKRPDFLRPAVTEVAVLTDDVLEKARALADRRWVLDACATGVVVLDPARMTQALLQLIANAVKFTGEGETIAVGSAIRGERLLLWVRDSGVGIAPSEVERIFERFARVETGRGAEGSGLGLSIVDAIASAHGGRVDVDSQLGRGSVFTIEVPVRRPPRAIEASEPFDADVNDTNDHGPGTVEAPTYDREERP